MAENIITAKNLGKRYKLGATLQHDTLRDHLAYGVKSLADTLQGKRKEREKQAEYFWALRDVSFEVPKGEVLGVIGHNGAGKSTLLKLLSQITEPTEGEIRLRGRVACLLEVGTGFHVELSGKENIYLNGAILGMSKAEIKQRFDEIVSFAEVEKFLDTPVRRYSTGMIVRLAFAVAAHLEPEILLVDEVLAVGDAGFQKRCLGKMDSVAKAEGRTILFVSHNMTAIQNLCKRVIHLKNGQITGIGGTDEMIQEYYAEQKRRSEGDEETGGVKLGELLNLERFIFDPNPVRSGEDVEFLFEISANEKTFIPAMQMLIYSGLGVRVGLMDMRQPDGEPHQLSPDKPLILRGAIRKLALVEGDYKIGLFISTPKYDKDFFDLTTLTVAPLAQTGGLMPIAARWRGLIEFDYSFNREK